MTSKRHKTATKTHKKLTMERGKTVTQRHTAGAETQSDNRCKMTTEMRHNCKDTENEHKKPTKRLKMTIKNHKMIT